MSVDVHLEIGGVRFGKALHLERAPIYLQFVVVGDDWDTLDALDQPEDRPRDGERIIAAKRGPIGTVHLDRTVNGRRVGEWLSHATYKIIDPQPADDILRDLEAWRAWATADYERTKGGPTV